jgi:hypothetical protein
VLKNGGRLRGVIVEEAKNYVVLDLGGGSITINKEEIKAIE